MNVDMYSLNQAIGTDFGTAYLFGISNSTNLIQDLVAREHWQKNIRTKMRFLPERDKASEEVERTALAMCEAAEEFLRNEKQHSVLPTSSPVVYSQLSSRLADSPSPFNPSNRIATASEMLDHTIASQETTRIVFTYLQWELSRRPTLQHSLRAELLTLSPPLRGSMSQLSAAHRTLPSLQALDALPLLDAVLKEALRIYTPSPAPLPRITPPEGAIIDGYTIPGRTIVGTSAYCVHRNEDVFPDAATFKPERWLKDAKEVREMMRWYWPFASGPRMCIGNHLALYSKLSSVEGMESRAHTHIVMKIVISTIYTNFETSIIDDQGIEQEDVFLAGPVGEKLVLRFHPVS